ncbi:uncharacterized protein LOC114517572 [Dendronephthya gigantea]|uniref:uncharacterized protein LOC114517572 n=1 Tax=Dendronephthya gigantea TaxID=151771 RepID=UPI00106B6EFC|nr:uncharacterized protein LOC114517572 [Dendronephthya gigantea]
MDTVSIIGQSFSALLALVFITIFLNTLIRRYLLKPTWPSQSRCTSTSRRLGKFEETMEIFSNERQGCTNSCYVMMLQSKEKLEESLIRKTLIRLAKRQPMLRAITKTVSNCSWFGSSSECYFEIIEPASVGDMINITKSDLRASQWQKSWVDIATKSVGAGLLWKLVLFSEEYLSDSENYLNTIVIRVNHCIVDGMSGMKLCKQFLNHLNSFSEDPRVHNEIVPSLELCPSFYEMIYNTQPWSLWKYLQETLGLYFIIKVLKRITLHISLISKPENPHQFFMMQPKSEGRDLRCKIFSESETLQIRKVCKSKGATVTGALMASAYFALCKLIESEGVTKPQELMQLFAVNGLRVCNSKPPEEYVGNFFLSEMLPMPYVSSENDFWATSQEATKGIQNIIKERGKDLSKHLAEYVIWTPREMVEEVLSPNNSSKELLNYVSSAGAFTFSDDDEMSTFKLQSCLFYSIPYAFSSFSCHFNTTVNGKMAWVIVCSDFVQPTIEDQFVNLCFDTFQKEIHCQSQEP